MKGLRDISVRLSGLVTEATLTPKERISLEDVARAIGLSERTLREKSSSRTMYTMTVGQASMLANMAGCEIEFVKTGGER